jgi:hypothetical protein
MAGIVASAKGTGQFQVWARIRFKLPPGVELLKSTATDLEKPNWDEFKVLGAEYSSSSTVGKSNNSME